MRTLALVLLASCAARPQTSDWIEHDANQRHDTRGGTAIVPTTLDVAKLDTYDEATLAASLERSPNADVAMRAARLAHHRGDDAIARSYLARVSSPGSEVTALQAELAEAPVNASIVAVLLPLSGKYAAIGLELRAAIELAPSQGTRWLFLDTKGDAETASAAVDTAMDKGAMAILGPVGDREALAAARRASLRKIPIALLAPADGADPAAGVFRMVWSIGDEARAVAKLAIDQGFPTAAVFSPRDDLGSEAADAFVAEAQRLGVEVTRRGTYDPTGGDVEPDVKDFLDLVPSRNPRLASHLARKGAKKGWSTFSPDVPFTLLYIPDRYDRAAIVAAFLPYYNVELRTIDFPDPAMLMRKHDGHMPQVVQLVGGAGWHHPSMPIRGGAPIQGSLIVDVFGGDSVGGVEEQFAAGLQQKMGRAPTAASAQAYDAATIVAAARSQASDRAGMTRALAHARLDDGACGPAQMGPDGELARAANILEVSGDELVPAP